MIIRSSSLKPPAPAYNDKNQFYTKIILTMLKISQYNFLDCDIVIYVLNLLKI